MRAARSLWQGRALALLGIMLVAFSLRSAVASLSPILDYVTHDFAISPVVLGLIGTAPPVCFAILALLTPLLERRFGLERVALVAMMTITVGLLLRSVVGDALPLLLSTVVIFAGVGAGNVLLPPLVKKYFPDRLGLMMTLYTTVLAVSTFLPPMIAVPIADTAGWRISLGMWGIFALLAVLPWALMVLRDRDSSTAKLEALEECRTEASEDFDPIETVTGPISTTPADTRSFARLLRLPLAWSVAIVFGTSSTVAYVMFAWLPTILVDLTGVTLAEAGFLLSVFAVVGLPCSMLVPVLVVRFHATRAVSLVVIAGTLVGITGLVLAPTAAPVLWVILIGLQGALFPLGLVLINVRARTHQSAVALSGFVQTVGYTFASIFPFLTGLLHSATGSWELPLIVLTGVLVVAIPASIIAGRRRTVEDEWEARHGAW